MLHLYDSIDINAPAKAITAAYLDIPNWSNLFPETIIAATVVQTTGRLFEVEVQHRYEGKVINILSVTNNSEIKLEEFKRRYDAVFINRFAPTEFGSRYDIEAFIKFKGIYILAQPFLRSLAKRRITKYVLFPMKQYMEKDNLF